MCKSEYIPKIVDAVQVETGGSGILSDGRFYVIRLADGEVRCWGNNEDGQCNCPSDLRNVTSVVASYSSAAAITKNGDVYCWGYGWPVSSQPVVTDARSVGEAGSGKYFAILKCKRVVLFTNSGIDNIENLELDSQSVGSISDLSMWQSRYASVKAIVDEFGTTYYEAQETHGLFHRLRLKSYESRCLNDPGWISQNLLGKEKVFRGKMWPQAKAVLIGEATCAEPRTTGWGAFILTLLADGSVAATGDNNYGQCGVPSSLRYGIKNIAVWTNVAMALTHDGQIVCWGDNQFGQCNVPSDIGAAIDMSFKAGVMEDGRVVVWE